MVSGKAALRLYAGAEVDEVRSFAHGFKAEPLRKPPEVPDAALDPEGWI